VRHAASMRGHINNIHHFIRKISRLMPTWDVNFATYFRNLWWGAAVVISSGGEWWTW